MSDKTDIKEVESMLSIFKLMRKTREHYYLGEYYTSRRIDAKIKELRRDLKRLTPPPEA